MAQGAALAAAVSLQVTAWRHPAIRAIALSTVSQNPLPLPRSPSPSWCITPAACAGTERVARNNGTFAGAKQKLPEFRRRQEETARQVSASARTAQFEAHGEGPAEDAQQAESLGEADHLRQQGETHAEQHQPDERNREDAGH